MTKQSPYGINTEENRNTEERVDHPKFGEGIIEKIEQRSCSVSLHIRFGEELKVIDQKWLLQTKYKKRKSESP